MGVIDSIKKIDTELFLFLNGKHTESLDTVMAWTSSKYVWIPLYLFFLYLVAKYVGKHTWLVMLAVLMAILFSDQASVHLFKNVFLRYRPCHNLDIQSLVHVNGNCGGQYGFVSSHASNTFALAMFLSLFFCNRIRFFCFYIFTWAIFVSYSRIYNGVHYPADVAVGGMVGIMIGWIVFRVYRLLNERLHGGVTTEQGSF